MRTTLALLDTGSRSLSYFLGLVAVSLAIAVGWTSLAAAEIAEWALRVFGLTFLALYGGLVFAALFSWTRLRQAAFDAEAREVWTESGLHAAGGVSTLALTYTLLGISLGIGTLAHQDLTPDTVQGVIRSLTEHFSLAFMTTVVGLPTAAVLRALVGITAVRLSHAPSLVRPTAPPEFSEQGDTPCAS